MSQYLTRFVSSKKIAKDTIFFTFEKPAGFSYLAGQCVDVTILKPKYEDDRGDTRSVTLVSAPKDLHIAIAMRMRDSAFKKNLNSLALGDNIKIDGPYGSFTYNKSEAWEPVFIAGGIGITPVISILSELGDNFFEKITLLYSNRDLESFAFLEELKSKAQDNENFKLVTTITSQKAHNWDGPSGRIDCAFLKRHVKGLDKKIFYISGSVDFVVGIRNLLLDMGIFDDNIRTDEMAGY
jgi:ferredoxin-NADP reductase